MAESTRHGTRRRGLRSIRLYLLAAIALVSAACEIQGQTESVGQFDSLNERHTVDSYIKQAMAEGKTPNRLIDEKSPYLLQHAFNPVDWYPWGEEAFEAAREQDKPIFLSIGYSTCHWCHVMEHESFENDSLAAVMNEHFVSIKVDREEMPDVDSDPHDEFGGKNILFRVRSEPDEPILADARLRLFRERSTRPRPQMDDKVVTSWNGLMISALARAFQVLREPRYLDAAENAASFIQTVSYDPGARSLFRRYRDGGAVRELRCRAQPVSARGNDRQ